MKCIHCGAEISDEAKFCPECGKSLTEPVQKAEEPKNEKSKKEKKKGSCLGTILKVIGAIVVLFVVLMFLLPSGNSTKAPAVGAELSEEDYKASCEEYTYEEISRNPDQYKEKLAKFKGQVIQVVESGNDLQLRVNVTADEYGFYSDTIYVTYSKGESESRILENDIVEVYGVLDGLYTYKSIMNSTVTLPIIHARFIDLAN